MEFCVYPEFRGNSMGKKCAKALLNWAKKHGALYAELNYGNNERRLRFWKSIGFIENGVDEWGKPLMLLPPTEGIPITVEILQDPTDWQLLKQENGFKKEIGEESLSEEQQTQLQEAVKKGNITFFLAKRGYRAVGMCSVTKVFSTFTLWKYRDFDFFSGLRRFSVLKLVNKETTSQSFLRCKELSIFGYYSQIIKEVVDKFCVI